MTSPGVHTSPWAIIFGILGNIVSFIVFVAPVPTFWRVYKKKSTEGFQCVPYVFALFSAMIWIYYAFLKSDEMLLITINSFGCVIETIYISMYLTYAPKQARVSTLKLLLLVNFGGFCSILLLSHFLEKGDGRVRILGWVCVAFSVSVFAAPLSIMRSVIRTKSVEFMPFSLSFFLTLSAVMWLFYGLLLKDLYVAAPNILGFTFGVIQMILYAIYRKRKPVLANDEKLPEYKADVVKLPEHKADAMKLPKHKADVVEHIQNLTTTPDQVEMQHAIHVTSSNTDEKSERTDDQYVPPPTCHNEKIIEPSMPGQVVTCEV